jgi:hypothetical protein
MLNTWPCLGACYNWIIAEYVEHSRDKPSIRHVSPASLWDSIVSEVELSSNEDKLL